jgi:ribosomal protein S12 methylthiotransferase
MINNEKIHVITLGCSKNTVDSERLVRQLHLNNFNVVEQPADADTVIINTCGFIEAAREESINTILTAAQMKKSGKLKKVIVAGCLSERYKDDLLKEIPEVDVYFGTEQYEGIVTELGGELRYNLLGERHLSQPSHSTYLKISEGCDHPCSFCSIPQMRGLHKSKPMEQLLSEAEFLAGKGARELIIIAQDTTDYGKDIYGAQILGTLLNKLSEIKGIEWIRLMYAYPSHFPEDVIEVIAGNDKICKYLDIPLQHISDDVLKSMRRGVTGDRTKELIKRLKLKIPGIALRTTFITGYPNETKKDFDELCSFVKDVEFDRFGVFTYSVEESTSAYILGDPVSAKEKERRRNTLMEIQKEISLKKNSSYIGENYKVLIDGKEDEFYIGRTYRDAPEVDGEVLIPADRDLRIGEFYNVKIYDNSEYDLFGRIITES